MHLLLHDYANYAFTKQLAENLVSKGIEVTYAFNSDFDGPNAHSALPKNTGVNFLPIGELGIQGARVSFSKRLRSELAYSKKLNKEVSKLKIDAVLSANAPSIVQNRLAKKARADGIVFFSWLQDLYGFAAKKLLSKKLPIIGNLIGAYFISLDRESLRLSKKAVLITDGFRTFATESGLSEDRIHVLENWAPIKDIPMVPKENKWSVSQGLSNSFRFVYSGTLAMKHNPALLLELAKSLAEKAGRPGEDPAEVLVISSSPGAIWLEKQASTLQLSNLRRLDFQPSSDFPAILGSADVLVAILEQDASTFSVPSKVLSYLCAGKPILAAIPSDNLAARIIRDADAGVVVNPSAITEFAQTGLGFSESSDPIFNSFGANARRYAEKAFDLHRVSAAFASVVMPGSPIQFAEH